MKRLLAAAIPLLLLLLLLPGVAHAQITADTVTSGATTGASLASSLTFSHTVGSGNNRLLVVGVSFRVDNGNNNIRISNMTYGGAGMTCQFARTDNNSANTCQVTGGNGTNVRSEIWTLSNPTSGAASVAITINGGNTTTITATAQSYANVVSVAAGNTGGTTSSVLAASVTSTAIPAGGLLLDNLAFAKTSTTLTATGTGHTLITDVSDTNNAGAGTHIQEGFGQVSGQASSIASYTWATGSPYAEVTAVLTPVVAGTISKAFAPTSIPVNGTSTLTLTFSNSNTVALVGAGVVDNLPAGVQVAGTPAASNTCGATFNPAAAATTLTVTGGTVPASGNCTAQVNVTSAAAGTYNNTTNAVTSTNGGTGAVSNTATLTVTIPPTIAKAFGTGTIALNTSTSLTLTITNPSATVTQTGVAFTDNFPAGLVVATPNGLSATCSGTITATQGTGVVSLSGGTLAASGSCTIAVNVTGTTAGSKNNSVTVSSTNQGTGNTSSATLVVVAPPTIAKVFGSASMAQTSGTSTMTITITNPAANTVALSGVAVSDTFPAGMTLTANGATTCTGATLTGATTGASSFSLSGGTINTGANCTITGTVSDTTAGVATNTTGTVSSTNGGTGTTASTTIAVEIPPTITKAFAPTTTTVNGTSTLTITITNPAGNTVQLTGLAISDTFPANMKVATPANLTNTCNGTPVGAAGATTVSLTGGTVNANSSCAISFSVTTTTAGSFVNTTGNVSATNGGTGTTATATLTVTAPPTITKAFAPTTIAVGGVSTLTLTITNPAANAGAMNGIAVSDTFPAGMQVAATPNAGNTCGGTFAPAAGNTTISLTAGTIATPGDSCAVNVDVTATTAGAKSNTTGTVSSTNDGTGLTANAVLTVVGPPTITKAFNPTSIPINGTSAMTITITNPAANTVALTGVAVSDTFPADMVFSANGATTCTGASLTGATTGSATFSLSGGSINTGASCTITGNVTAPTSGVKTNTTGTVSSTNGGTGLTATAALTVNVAPTITKSFAPTSMAVNGTSLLSIVITNPAGNVALTGLAVSDTFPANMKVGATPTLTNSCGGTVTGATANSTTVSLSGGTVGVNTSCTISFNVTATTGGSFVNTTGTVSATNGGTGTTATATLTVNSAPGIAKAFNPTTVSANGISTLTLTFSNSNGTALTGVNISDTFPTGVAVANPPNINNTCGSTLSGATAGSGSVSSTNGTIPANGSCIVAIDVTPSTGGSKVNVTGAVSSTNGGVGGTATATLTVNQAPAITSAASASFTLSAPGSFQVTATGTPAPTFSEVGALPTGVTFTSAGLLSGTPTQTGSFPIVITATNGNAPDATQNFTLSVVSQANYTQPFNTGHGWTYTQLTCSGATCSNNAAITDATNCGPGGTGTTCVEATNNLTFNLTQTMTGYFHNPAGYTWLTLGVPAGATVTTIQGSFYDKTTPTGGGCAAGTAGLEIYNAANTTALTSAPIITALDVTPDTGASGATHSGGVLTVNSSQAAASGITLRFNINPSAAGAFGSSKCEIFGDNINLVIAYSSAASGPKRRGQVIIGMNRQSDGSFAEAWAYNVDLSEAATPINLAEVKFERQGRHNVTVDTTSLEGDGRKVTKIALDNE